MNLCWKQVKLKSLPHTLFWLVAAVQLSLGWMACTPALQHKADAPGTEGLSDSLRAAYLEEIQTILRRAPKRLDPGQAERVRQQLQHVLDVYFPAAGREQGDSLISYSDRGSSVSPVFPGTVLDLVLLTPGSTYTTLVALERDSIALLRLQGQRWRRRAASLGGFKSRDVRPMWPAGRLGAADLDGNGVKEVFARHTGFEGLLIWRWRRTSGTLEPVRYLRISQNADLLAGWDPGDFQPGRPFFSVRGFPVRFAYDRVALGTNSVVLDTVGGLWLTDSRGEILDRLPGPFGNRLVPMSESRLVALHRYARVLTLFGVEEDHLQPIARSPKLNADILAAAATRNGLWLALSDAPDHYRLRFLPISAFTIIPSATLCGLPRFGGRVVFFLPRAARLTDVRDLWSPSLVGLLADFYPTLTQRPDVLQKLESVPGRPGVVEISVRPGMHFSDGAPLSAPALKAGWEWLAKSPAAAADRWWWSRIDGFGDFVDGRAQEITGIQAVDSLTLRLHGVTAAEARAALRRPSFAAISLDSGSGLPRGIGAFQPLDISGGKVVAVANLHDPRGRAILDTIVVKTVGRDSTLDLLGTRPAAAVWVESRDLVAMLRDSNLRTLRPLDPRLYVLVVGSRRPPLDQPEVRATVLQLIKPELLSEVVVSSFSTPLSTLFHFPVPVPAPDRIDVRARHPLPVEYPSEDRTAREIAERLAARMAAVGIPARLVGTATAADGLRPPRPMGIRVDFARQPGSDRVGVLYEFLLRFGRELAPETERLVEADRTGVDVERTARGVLRDLALQARLRPVLAVQPFIALPAGFVAVGSLPGGWPDLGESFWQIRTEAAERSQ